MIAKVLLGGLLIVGLGGGVVLVKRQSFNSHLDRLEAEIRNIGATQGPRTDLGHGDNPDQILIQTPAA